MDGKFLGTQHRIVALEAADHAEPRPFECLPCYVRRMLRSGCRGMHWIAAYRAARPPGALLLARAVVELGASCDCEVIESVYEPRMFQTRTDDGEYIRPRPLVDIHACHGVGPGVDSGGASGTGADRLDHCELWEPKVRHPGPPWT